ncbi:hypothetical protein GY45DRAFT_1375284 [Cubamyces sp. BRFM 1775]|nr:hypothetical protein GY45DRAFT_1375284 [Cubamyces sp. BRFM 1775]
MFRAAEAGTGTSANAHGQMSPGSTKRVSASPKKAKKDKRVSLGGARDIPMGTAASAVEVEEAVTMNEGEGEVSLGGQMDVDADFASLEKEGPQLETMDVDEEAGPSKPPLSKRGPPSKGATKEAGPSTDTTNNRRLVRRFTSRSTDNEGEATPAESPKSKAPLRTYGSAKASRDKPVGVGASSPLSSPSPSKKPQSTRRPSPAPDEDVVMEGTSEVQPRPKKEKMKKKGPPGVRVTKVLDDSAPEEPVKRRPIDILLESDSDSDEEDVRSVLGDLARNGRTSRTSGAKAGQTPRKLESVVVPTVESVYGSPTKKGEKEDASDPGKLAAPKPARGRSASTVKKPARPPSPSSSPSELRTSPSPPPPPKTTRKPKAAPAEASEAGPSRSSIAAPSVSPNKFGRTPSRRMAATKATQKLHDVIMPDVLSFQKELKKGTVRPAHELEQAASKGKARAQANGAGGEPKMKGKKRPSLGSGEEEEDDEEMPEKKKCKGGAGVAEVESAPEGNAPRSLVHVCDVQYKRTGKLLMHNRGGLFHAAIVLLINMWGGKKAGLFNPSAAEDVHKCMSMLRVLQPHSDAAARLWHVLDTLYNAGNFKATAPEPSRKRARDAEQETSSSAPNAEPTAPDAIFSTSAPVRNGGMRPQAQQPADYARSNLHPSTIAPSSQGSASPYNSDAITTSHYGQGPSYPDHSSQPHSSADPVEAWKSFDLPLSTEELGRIPLTHGFAPSHYGPPVAPPQPEPQQQYAGHGFATTASTPFTVAQPQPQPHWAQNGVPFAGAASQGMESGSADFSSVPHWAGIPVAAAAGQPSSMFDFSQPAQQPYAMHYAANQGPGAVHGMGAPTEPRFSAEDLALADNALAMWSTAPMSIDLSDWGAFINNFGGPTSTGGDQAQGPGPSTSEHAPHFDMGSQLQFGY